MSERCPAMSRHQCRTRQSQILNVQDFALQRTSADTSAWNLASWPLLGPVVDMASMMRPVTEAQRAPPPGHSRVTHSRNRAVLAGHQRTQRPRHLSSAGPRRSRRDTRGRATDTVRDREARVKSRAPDQFLNSESANPMVPRRSPVTGRSQIFLELGGGSPVQVDCGPSIELAHGSRTADISARARP